MKLASFRHGGPAGRSGVGDGEAQNVGGPSGVTVNDAR